ncbi:hypothetical protein PV325_010449 [Microctonus aethiopoides]|nr:hypothetical protein PV325_010449 [Microctonus aethiopoides]
MEEVNVSSQEEVCGVCYETAQLKCGACKAVFYCSRKHQKIHWKQHIKDCTPFKMSENSILGRHYIATRKIDIGEIILEEIKPLVSAPLNDTCPLCLNCFSILNIFNAQPCEKCGWPLCKICTTHGSECEFTIKHRGIKVHINNFEVPHPTYKCIGVVRALALREIDPDNYKKFLSLQSHWDDNDEEKHLDNRETEFVEIARFVKGFFKLKDNEITLKEIIKILGIYQINGHEVPTTENPHVAVYDIASYFEHNCRANCSKSFTENGGIIIRAATTILKGQHITLCYTDPLWGTTNRRHHLLKTKFFDCMCNRCCDPTEFGTMFNALKCTRGVNEKLPDYTCTKCHEAVMSWKNAEIILENIGIELATMTKNSTEACRKFIKRYCKIIHENHFYMVDVKLALVQLIGQQSGGLSMVDDDILDEKITLCKTLNHLLCTIVPAENRIRGLILFEMHAGLAEYGRRQGKNKLYEILTLSRDALTEAHQLLHHESEILPEGKIAQIAQQNIHEINAIMNKIDQN